MVGEGRQIRGKGIRRRKEGKGSDSSGDKGGRRLVMSGNGVWWWVKKEKMIKFIFIFVF